MASNFRPIRSRTISLSVSIQLTHFKFTVKFFICSSQTRLESSSRVTILNAWKYDLLHSSGLGFDYRTFENVGKIRVFIVSKNLIPVLTRFDPFWISSLISLRPMLPLCSFVENRSWRLRNERKYESFPFFSSNFPSFFFEFFNSLAQDRRKKIITGLFSLASFRKIHVPSPPLSFLSATSCSSLLNLAKFWKTRSSFSRTWNSWNCFKIYLDTLLE